MRVAFKEVHPQGNIIEEVQDLSASLDETEFLQFAEFMWLVETS